MKPKKCNPKGRPTDRNRRKASSNHNQARRSYPWSQGEKFDVLLSTTMEGYWLVGPDRRIQDVNEQASKMLGYTRDETLPRYVMTDPNKLRSIFENSLKFTRFGSVTMRVWAKLDESVFIGEDSGVLHRLADSFEYKNTETIRAKVETNCED